MKTSMIAWAVELFGSTTIIIFHYLAHHIGLEDQWAVWIVISIYFVLIPGCYLLVTDDVRRLIVEVGWCNPFKITCHNNQVAPGPIVQDGQ